MCEEILVPAGNLYTAEGLSEKAAAMVEFLAIGAHGVRRARLRPGSDTLIVGAGPIGIGTALFASIEGAQVTLRDGSQARLDLAKTVLPNATVECTDQKKQRSYETVFDATGNIGAMNAGLNWLAHGGTYVLLSVVKEDLRFADPEFHKRETTLVGSRNALVDDFEHVMAQIRAGTVPVDALATHETTLGDAVTDLPLWAGNRETLIKAIIRV
jgi:2-desacetyl-2-hydroxyethyl bacteriochlorophyllide A dehydrogenase